MTLAGVILIQVIRVRAAPSRRIIRRGIARAIWRGIGRAIRRGIDLWGIHLMWGRHLAPRVFVCRGGLPRRNRPFGECLHRPFVIRRKRRVCLGVKQLGLKQREDRGGVE